MAVHDAERRREIECAYQCPDCGGTPYKLWRLQNQQPDGTLLPTYANQVWPAHPDLPPPFTNHMTCPDCGCELKRVAP